MIVLSRILFFLEAATVVAWLGDLGLSLAIVHRLRRGAPAEGRYQPSFSEWVPVPRGKPAEQYARQFPGRRTLRTAEVLYESVMLGFFAWAFVDLFSRIFRYV
ncbi:MAG: hypothetical protein WA192_04170 [Candidatus Acidiferrales bacterium]